ncbi:hypothetical protein NDU88_009363 [Pleurodeles waltl]|uniref:Uncharacterized protein n=1 Tax=Pleurodeles waltl TaxID=8319 RepID=A0AAV7PVM7_PLEWA|nr:hypothetical protein NDU88_009363 [Pleurodeles waltl]
MARRREMQRQEIEGTPDIFGEQDVELESEPEIQETLAAKEEAFSFKDSESDVGTVLEMQDLPPVQCTQYRKEDLPEQHCRPIEPEKRSSGHCGLQVRSQPCTVP